MASVSSESERGDLLAQAISSMVTKKTQEIIEEECVAAVERVRERLRGSVGEIAGRVLQTYEMRFAQNRIIIEVSMPSDQPGKAG